ncbi:cytochrome c oxidase assembly protein [Devosia sediminis]|uniref:Cytochrome c oxidase assembly protein CtaG n=1 Tax=Devosia sediminis TaxID=2798801 RepID=A0A934MMM2_9HYPH|nr:cytochrome c oxidase assembly protein [Devosia sediminis]MBJ3786360.1 cytochrome c oxidase assembly protein [Devosia sediminis]
MSETTPTRSDIAAACLTLLTPIMAGMLGFLLAQWPGLSAGAAAGYLILVGGARADAGTGNPRRLFRNERGGARHLHHLATDAFALARDAVVVLWRQTAWTMFGLRSGGDGPDRSTVEFRNRRLFRSLSFLAVGMVGMAFAAVPLYGMFCSITGYGGTPARSDGNLKGIVDRPITVRFDSNVDPDLPWHIVPAASVTRDIGTVEQIDYVATNTSDEPVTGMAVFNIAPDKAGIYFNKIECFCFTEQTLQPGETLKMPIVFFVDPDFADNRELDTLREITLSYSFYRK